MSDIKFTCTHCTQRIKVPSAVAGQAVECPSCHVQTIVPPNLDFGLEKIVCPHCSSTMETEGVGDSDTIECPACHKHFTEREGKKDATPSAPTPVVSSPVDQNPNTRPITYTCPNCHQQIEAPPDMAGQAAECPSCHGNTMVPLNSDLGLEKITCPSCGSILESEGVSDNDLITCPSCHTCFKEKDGKKQTAKPVKIPRISPKQRERILISADKIPKSNPLNRQTNSTPIQPLSSPHRQKKPIRWAKILAVGGVGLLVMAIALIIWAVLRTNAERVSERAGAFLMESEVTVWTLQGVALEEARRTLSSGAASKLCNENRTDTTKNERVLRDLLRKQWSGKAKTLAGQFILTLDNQSKGLLADAAKRCEEKEDEFILEWITYESVLDFAMIHLIWMQRGNVVGQDKKKLMDSFLKNMVEPPTLTRGVQVMAKTTKNIIINVYGASIIEEIVPEHSHVSSSTVSVRWKSNYDRLRDLFSGKASGDILEENVSCDNDVFGMNYTSYIEEYLERGHPFPWATCMSKEDLLTIARLVNEQAIFTASGNPITNASAVAYSPTGAETLQELFPRLSRSVPLIQNIGVSSGSGLLVRHGGKLFVASNRHVVENCSDGYKLTFFPPDGGKESLTIHRSVDDVSAIHQKFDLALISVDDCATQFDQKGIRPLDILPEGMSPSIGERVFAIGHPGSGGEELLIRTLTDGIISAVRTLENNGPCLQVTAPINPGNSGGPLFNSRGEVIGVVTFAFRQGKGGIALESLNFAISTSSLRDLLSNPSVRLKASELSNILKPSAEESTTEIDDLVRRMTILTLVIQKKGYAPYTGDIKTSGKAFVLDKGDKKVFNFRSTRGNDYIAAAVPYSSSTIRIGIISEDGETVATSDEDDSSEACAAAFHALASKRYYVVIVNTNPNRKAGAMWALFEK